MSLTKLLSSLALAAVALHAQAGDYTVTATQAVVTGEQSITFDSASAGTSLSSYMESGVKFDGGWVWDHSENGQAKRPVGSAGNYIAIGSPGHSSFLDVTFAANTSFFSFLWGTPDTYNTLLVTTNKGTYTYTPGSMHDLPASNDSHYLNWTADAGETITSLRLTSSNPAFEVDNFAVAVVPEPASMAMLLAGLVLIGSVSRRRRIG